MTFRSSKRNQVGLADFQIINAKGAEAARDDPYRLRKAISRNCNHGIAYAGAISVRYPSADRSVRGRRNLNIDSTVDVNRG